MSNSSIEYLSNFDWKGTKLGLDRIRELLDRMGNPQRQLRFIHLAGTNGKGSTACFLANMLQAAGYKTGLHTSPYIHAFNERMQIDGVPISEAALDMAVAAVRPHAEMMADHPTTFELVTATAFSWFAAENCDIVVLETGMGGALDATNIIDAPEVAVITPIGLDHTDYLGKTLGEIARSKAGIIKAGAPVVTAPQPGEAMAVLRETAAERGAELITVNTAGIKSAKPSLEGQRFSFGGLKDLTTGLLGPFQLENAALALTVADVLEEKRGFTIPEEARRKGLAEAKWPGRFELAGRSPTLIVDGGHNPPGAVALAAGLRKYFPGKRAVFITGVLADKDYAAMLEPLLPLAQQVFTITPDNPRAMDAEELARYISGRGVTALAAGSVDLALALARNAAGPPGLVCYFGSLYSVGAVRRVLGMDE